MQESGGGGTTGGGRKRVEKGRKAGNWVSPCWRFLQLAAACAAFAIILRANEVGLHPLLQYLVGLLQSPLVYLYSRPLVPCYPCSL